jgi:hypothetical protein
MHSTLSPARNQSSSDPAASLSDAARCACPGCRRHLARQEEFNRQLARSNDELRRERDELALRLARKEAA